MGGLKKKLRGATLVEAIVSMMIIMMVFIMFVMVYTNVMTSDNGPKKLKGISLVNDIVSQTKETTNYTDTIMKEDSLTVSRNVKPGNSVNTVLLTYRVTDKNGTIIAKREEVVVK